VQLIALALINRGVIDGAFNQKLDVLADGPTVPLCGCFNLIGKIFG
jgi:hypothetical protein